MIRSSLTLSSLALALMLSGCASESTAPAASTAAAPAASAAPAVKDDAVAGKLKGNWVGDWSMGGYGGKFELMATEINGTNVKGSANWYGTAAGDKKEPLTKGVVQNGVLSGEQSGGWTFKLSMKSDDALAGTWSVAGYSGQLKLTRAK